MPAQLAFPVVELPFAFFALQPIPLPFGIIGVLHRHLGKSMFFARYARFVQCTEFTEKDVDGPAVGNDMVQGKQQHVFPIL